MAQDSTPAIVIYQGDGYNNVFSVPFDKGFYGDVKIAFVRRGLSTYNYEPDTYTISGVLYAWVNGITYVYTHTNNPAIGAPTYDSGDVEQEETVSAISGQTITVDGVVYSRAQQHDIIDDLLLTWTGDTLEVGDYICIIRDTEREQPYVLPSNQKHIEGALDNLERQIQEVANKTDNALLVDPSHTTDSSKMNPVDWLNTIVRSLDMSVRGLKYADNWVLYSTDDPNIDEMDKTWTRLLNTENILSIREKLKYDSNNNPVYYTQYKDQSGQWKTLSDAASWEARIVVVEGQVADAVFTAGQAKEIAVESSEKVDTFDGRITAIENNSYLIGYTHEQATAATTWHVVHDLDRFPSVTVVDSAGTEIECDVTYINSNECELKFNSAFKGNAYLN